MANYSRLTAAPISEVLRVAEKLLTERLPTEVTERGETAITFSGGDGTVTFHTHRHGMQTEVRAMTDQLRTSRLDIETQKVLNAMPYQPEDSIPE